MSTRRTSSNSPSLGRSSIAADADRLRLILRKRLRLSRTATHICANRGRPCAQPPQSLLGRQPAKPPPISRKGLLFLMRKRVAAEAADSEGQVPSKRSHALPVTDSKTIWVRADGKRGAADHAWSVSSKRIERGAHSRERIASMKRV